MLELSPQNKEFRKIIQNYAEEVHGGDTDKVSKEEIRGIIVVYLMGRGYAEQVHQSRVELVTEGLWEEI